MPILSAVRRSLRTKIVIVVLVTTFIALSLATALMLTNEVDYYRNFLLADATTQADLLARVSAPALQFDDPKAAATNLELLNNRPSIRAAAIYTPDGTIFATFSRPDSPAFPPLGPPGVKISGGTLTMFQPIVQNEERLGTVYLESVYDLRDRVGAYVLILGGVMLGGMVVAGIVALWLARSVTQPVAAITGVARAVIARRDFTLRAKRTTQDEIGVLVDAFNTMLAEEAHLQCLAIGLINDVFQIKQLAEQFDFALNEQCHHCGWCDLYRPFVRANKPVLHLEFHDNEGFCKSGSPEMAEICKANQTADRTTFSSLKRAASSKLHLPDRPQTCN